MLNGWYIIGATEHLKECKMESIFGKRLKELREKRKMSQRQVADKIGVTASAISAYETGIRMPGGAAITALSNLFLVSPDYLLGNSDTPTQSSREGNVVSDDLDLIFSKIKSIYTASDENMQLEIRKFLSSILGIITDDPIAENSFSQINHLLNLWKNFVDIQKEQSADSESELSTGEKASLEEDEAFKEGVISAYNHLIEWLESYITVYKAKKFMKNPDGSLDPSKLSLVLLQQLKNSNFNLQAYINRDMDL